jgi:hypothetical protein
MPPTLTEQLNTLWTTTWQNMRTEAIDQVFGEHPFWFWLSHKGKRRTEAGGRYISIPLSYGKNTTFTTLGMGGQVDITRQEKLMPTQWNWKYAAISVIRYWIEGLQNRGKAQIMSIMKNELENAKLSMAERLEEMLYGDGTGNGGKDFDGLGNIVAIDPTTGTVGGLNSATYDWWRNKTKNMSGEPMSTYLITRMRTMYNDVSKGQGSGTPDFLLTTQTIFEYYESEVQEQKQIVNQALGDAMFETVNFKGKPVTWAEKCPSGRLFFLNSRHLEWVADPAANFYMTKWKEMANQVDDAVAQIAVAGNLVCNNRQRQGVIYNIDE